MRASGGLPLLFLTHFRNRNWKHVCAPRIIYLSLSGLLSFKSSRLFLLALIVSLLLRPRLRFCPILLSCFSFFRHLRSPSHKRNDSFLFLKLSMPSCITKNFTVFMTCEIHLKLHIHQTYNIESANACPWMRMQLTNKGNVVFYRDKDLVRKV